MSDEIKFTVVAYDKQSGYHECVGSDGKAYKIDLCVAAVFERENHDDSWYLGKTFKGDIRPWTWIAYDFKEVIE